MAMAEVTNDITISHSETNPRRDASPVRKSLFNTLVLDTKATTVTIPLAPPQMPPRNRYGFFGLYSSVMYQHMSLEELRRLERNPDMCDCLDKVDDLKFSSSQPDLIADSVKLTLLLCRNLFIKHQALSRETSGDFSRCRIRFSDGSLYVGSLCLWYETEPIFFYPSSDFGVGNASLELMLLRMSTAFIHAVHVWALRRQIVRVVENIRINCKYSYSMEIMPQDLDLIMQLDDTFKRRYKFKIERPAQHMGRLYTRIILI